MVARRLPLNVEDPIRRIGELIVDVVVANHEPGVGRAVVAVEAVVSSVHVVIDVVRVTCALDRVDRRHDGRKCGRGGRRGKSSRKGLAQGAGRGGVGRKGSLFGNAEGAADALACWR